VMMKRVREAIAFNAALADESIWLWLTSEQMRPTGGGQHKERAEDLYSSQRVRDNLVAYHLAPAITEFIWDENWECCNNELEQTLVLSYSEWSNLKRSSPRGKAKHIIHLLSATQLTRMVQSSCAEACGGKCPRCQQL